MTRKPWWVYDPKTKQIDCTCGIKDPIECAHYLWEHYDPGTPVDLKYAVEYVRATGDRKLFDAVEGWVKGDGRPMDVLTGQPVGTPESVKAPLYDLLHEQKKPGDKNVARDKKLRHIAMVLMTYFDDACPNRSRGSATADKDKVDSAASILATLTGAPGERTIEDIIRPVTSKGSKHREP